MQPIMPKNTVHQRVVWHSALKIHSTHIKKALPRGAQPMDTHTGPMELKLPAIKGIGGAMLYLIDRYEGENTIYDIDFTGLKALIAILKDVASIRSITSPIRYRGRMNFWAGFYEKLFNFKEIRYFDIKGEYTSGYRKQ